MIIEEVRLKVVNTQLESPEPLTNESLGAVQRRDQWVHQHVEVGQEGAEPNRDSQTQLHEKVLHVLLVLAALKTVQTCEGGQSTKVKVGWHT